MSRDIEKRGGVYRFKEFNENPHLLRRFLQSQGGRPWDMVYSEIRSNPDSRRSIGIRVLNRIKHLVATDCFLENKGVLRPGGGWGAYPPHDLYVHPKTDIRTLAGEGKVSAYFHLQSIVQSPSSR